MTTKNPTHTMRRLTLALAASLLITGTTAAQEKKKVDYHRADVIRTAGTYAFGANVYPNWLADSVRFWYTSSGRDDSGVVYLVDPEKRSRSPLFDNYRLAATLSLAADTILDHTRIPRFAVIDSGPALELEIRLREKIFRCDPASYECRTLDSLEWETNRLLEDGPSWVNRSPDGQWDVFRYGYNIYVRPASVTNAETIAKRDSILQARADTTTKEEEEKKAPPDKPDTVPIPKESTQLTMDGTRFFAYGGASRTLAADTAKPRPQWVGVNWSPHSRKFTVSRDDLRGLRVYPMYSSTRPQPVDRSYYYATPGDSIVPTWDVHVIDVVEHTNVRVDLPATPSATVNASTHWNRASDGFFLLNANRGPSRISLHSIDARTGEPTTVARDSTATWVELSHRWGGSNWDVVNGGEDVIWWSQRDGWAHLYRFDDQGGLKNQIESGPYAVDAIQKVDSVAKRVYFTAWGEDGAFPYYARLFRVNFDGSELAALTPEEGTHRVTLFPKGDYFIDTHSTVESPPVITLRSAKDGEVLMELQRGDVEYLRSLRWTPPEIIKVKARDGVTDLWGLLYKPSDFDSTKSYPLLDHIYPGPQVGSVRNWGFSSSGSEARALAELGFIVVEIDHMGTPRRSKAFHDFYYANMGDNGIPDHIAGIRQLAARHRWIDLDRVGIYGHSGGGFASTDAIFRYPKFYKVAVSGAGNHDPRTYAWYWAGRYQGPYDEAGYREAANPTHAHKLQGKLLIMHGDLDSNVHPANSYRVIDALIKANKDFDMIIFPDAGHGFPRYAIRKRWDYFVRHLLGAEPPKDYEMMDPPRGVFRF